MLYVFSDIYQVIGSCKLAI